MPLRKCAGCGGDLPAGATSRAKFCSATCRQRGHRSKEDGSPLSLVPPSPDTAVPSDPSPSNRLSALQRAAERLEELLDKADPRSAAPLNKEYRETLRELEAVRSEAQTEGARDRAAAGRRRPFSAAAI